MLDLVLTTFVNIPFLSASILVIVLSFIFYLKSRIAHPETYPPMPCRPVPFLGHVPFLKPTPRKVFETWRDKVGDIFSFYMGQNLYVVLSSYEVCEEAYVKKAEYFSDRPAHFSVRCFFEADDGEILSLGGNGWKEHRSVALSILRNFGMGKNLMATKISEEVEAYMKALSGMKGKLEDVRILTNSSVSNVICNILLGQRFEYDDKHFNRMVWLISEKIRSFEASSVIDAFWWLEYLPGDLFKTKTSQKISCELAKAFSEHFINKYKTDAYSTDDDNFIKAFLREAYKRKKSNINTAIDEKGLSKFVDFLFIVGTETTSTTILWSMIFAMNYPNVQKKVYEEIKRVVGTERVPNLQDRPKLNYLNAFIMETSRLGSIVPIGPPHICSESTTVGGYTIPKGTTILPHLEAILKDKKTYEDPMVFRPERFLDKDGNLVIPEQFVPFSLGRRYCLGESLAKMELFLFFSALYQRFEFIPEDPKYPPSMEPEAAMTMSPQPFKIHLVERV